MTREKRKSRWLWLLLMAALLGTWFPAEAMARGPEGELFHEDIREQLYQEGGFAGETIDSEPEVLSATDSDYAAAQQELITAFRSRQSYVDLQKYQLPVTEFKAFYRDVINENPEFFYVSGGYSYYPSGTIVAGVLPGYKTEYTKEHEKRYEETVAAILNQILVAGMSDLDKALVIHDYLVQNCTYDLSYQKYDAYQALVNQTAVCQGYSLAYLDLLKRAGVRAKVVSSDTMNHAWNLVLVNGKWYHVDCTWDDPVRNVQTLSATDRLHPACGVPGKARHFYFMLSDAVMGDTAHKHLEWNTEIPCTDTTYDTGTVWANLDSGIWLVNGKWYSVSVGNGSFSVMENFNTAVFTEQIRWKTWDSNASWGSKYAYLSYDNGLLYFNDPEHVYALKPGETTPCVVYTYQGGDGYLYGCHVSGGVAELLIAKSPNYGAGDKILTVQVFETKEKPPVVKLDTISEVVNTDSTMEYSVDQSRWNGCVSSMGIAQFDCGWDGTAAKTIYLRTKAGAGKLPSDPVALTLPVRPSLGHMTVTGETILGKRDGSIAGVTDNMIYRREGGIWESCSGKSFQALESGTYYFMIQAVEGVSLKSEVRALTVAAGIDAGEPFGDVEKNTWVYTCAKYVFDKGLMKGKGQDAYGNKLFDPNQGMTRAEFAQVLYNMEGKPQVSYEDCFSDVADGQWYTNAIIWAYQKGIVAGKGERRFDPNGNVTREEMATMFKKYAAWKEYDVEARADISAYSDTGKISSWAVENLKWAIAKGVMKGTADGRINPGGFATRAECAAMLKNFCTAFGE